MNTMTSLFQQAQLAEAAYANLTTAIGSKEILKFALNIANKDDFKGSFSTAQAAAFADRYQVISQYNASNDGFSGTLFKDTTTGVYTIAMRGTAETWADLLGADFGDIVADGLAMDQIVDMYNYFQSLTHNGRYEAAKLELAGAETDQLASLLQSYELLGDRQPYDTYLATLKASGYIIDSSLTGAVVRRVVYGDSDERGKGVRGKGVRYRLELQALNDKYLHQRAAPT